MNSRTVPETVAIACGHCAGVVRDGDEDMNLPVSNMTHRSCWHTGEPRYDALISRAATVAWLRAEADDPVNGGVPYTGWLRRLADAMERGWSEDDRAAGEAGDEATGASVRRVSRHGRIVGLRQARPHPAREVHGEARAAPD
jgi:hypothetical protein